LSFALQDQSSRQLEQEFGAYPQRILSGIRPTPAIHLGHYFGALKQHIRLQHEYPGESFFLIADYHALTLGPDPAQIKESTLEVAYAYIAFGLDPNKAILYRQSDVPQSLELFWILSCFCSAGDLLRLPVYAGAAEDGCHKTAGLLTYPVLMAADILGLRATMIPAGEDQIINIERAKDAARQFNNAYGVDMFPRPTLRLSDAETVRGTDGRKMCHAYNNVILPFEPYSKIQSRVRQIVTDSTSRCDPKNPETCTIFHLYSLVAPDEAVEEMRRRYQAGGIDYMQAKRELTLEIMEYFGEAACKYHDLKKHPDFVKDILREGFRQAAEQVGVTIEAVRQIVGLAI
jgi:tryptophanyl-tRNA synthetase